MYHKKLGITRIVNATVYASDYLSNPNWTTQSSKVSGYREGTLDKHEVLRDKAEYDLNKSRLDDPLEAKKRGDRQRAYEEGKIISHNAGLKEALSPNWKSMPWFKRRAYIKGLTGVVPKNKAHAEELMKNE